MEKRKEAQVNWEELGRDIKRLTALIDPLEMLLMQEKNPDLSARIERFIDQIQRVADQMDRAVTALEADQETRQKVKHIETHILAQAQDISAMKNDMSKVLTALGQPLGT